MVRKSKFKIFRDILLLLITLAILFIAGKGMIKSVVSDSQPFKSEEAGELDADSNTYMLKPMEPEQMFDGLDLYQYIEGQYTVLFLGFDEDQELTDVIWICQFDIAGGKLHILQVPRDCAVPNYTLYIPCLNHSYREQI